MRAKTIPEINKIAVIGQGYVGLPLAIELAYHYSVIGFDIDEKRVDELKKGIDKTHEADFERLNAVIKQAHFEFEECRKKPTSSRYQRSLTNGSLSSTICENKGLVFSADIVDIRAANVYIVTVPTPIDSRNIPDLSPLNEASKMVGSVLNEGDIVIYESTVYPGCTEEECVPILEEHSKMTYNRDFFVGYSPERINPGDKIHTLRTIKKVTSGSTPEIAERIDRIYSNIVDAGTYRAPSIMVAEASKAIENAQRDLNISFVNELALIFDKMGIDTHDVLEAAGTKFNFLKYKPGLVGGHCISVDPYYLTYKAIQLGYHPEVILSGRRVNNSIPSFIASKVVKMMVAKDIVIRGSRALLLGITFKENCPDIRNTKVKDIYEELKEYGIIVDVYDPIADPKEVFREFGIRLNNKQVFASRTSKYDAIILTTAHNEFLAIDLEKLRKNKSVIFDTKSVLPRLTVDARL